MQWGQAKTKFGLLEEDGISSKFLSKNWFSAETTRLGSARGRDHFASAVSVRRIDDFLRSLEPAHDFEPNRADQSRNSLAKVKTNLHTEDQFKGPNWVDRMPLYFYR